MKKGLTVTRTPKSERRDIAAAQSAGRALASHEYPQTLLNTSKAKLWQAESPTERMKVAQELAWCLVAVIHEAPSDNAGIAITYASDKVWHMFVDEYLTCVTAVGEPDEYAPTNLWVRQIFAYRVRGGIRAKSNKVIQAFFTRAWGHPAELLDPDKYPLPKGHKVVIIPIPEIIVEP